jgi:crotonobetaine/carnitine-CoA ligase
MRWIVVTKDNSGTPASAEGAADGFERFDVLYGDDAVCSPAFPGSDGARRHRVYLGHYLAPQGRSAHPRQRPVGGPTRTDSHLDAPRRDVPGVPAFFHVNAQSWSMWTTVLGAGGTIVLLPKFSASRFWRHLRRL